MFYSLSGTVYPFNYLEAFTQVSFTIYSFTRTRRCSNNWNPYATIRLVDLWPFLRQNNRFLASNHRQCLAALSLFSTLISINCEDFMFQLILRYLIPCTHMLWTQRNLIRKIFSFVNHYRRYNQNIRVRPNMVWKYWKAKWTVGVLCRQILKLNSENAY